MTLRLITMIFAFIWLITTLSSFPTNLFLCFQFISSIFYFIDMYQHIILSLTTQDQQVFAAFCAITIIRSRKINWFCCSLSHQTSTLIWAPRYPTELKKNFSSEDNQKNDCENPTTFVFASCRRSAFLPHSWTNKMPQGGDSQRHCRLRRVWALRGARAHGYDYGRFSLDLC